MGRGLIAFSGSYPSPSGLRIVTTQPVGVSGSRALWIARRPGDGALPGGTPREAPSRTAHNSPPCTAIATRRPTSLRSSVPTGFVHTPSSSNR